jgi:hypothetical protein
MGDIVGNIVFRPVSRLRRGRWLASPSSKKISFQKKISEAEWLDGHLFVTLGPDEKRYFQLYRLFDGPPFNPSLKGFYRSS